MDARPVRRTRWDPKACDICGAANGARTLGRRTYLCPARRSRYEMAHTDKLCGRCGFVFSGRVPQDAFLNKYYADSFTLTSKHATIAPAFDSDGRIRQLKKYLSSGASVLEIGANTGEFCRSLKKSGFRAEGVDPVAGASAERGVRRGFVRGKGRARGAFDAVVSYYVLEHVTDARGWLRSALAKLKKGGYLFIEVPDFENHPAESLDKEHLLHFTPHHLKRLLVSAGFRMVKVDRGQASQFFGFLAVAKWEGRPSARPAERAEGKRIKAGAATYYRGLKELEAKERRCRKKAEKIHAQVRKAGKKAEVIFWAANEYATGIGREFRQLSRLDPVIVDSSEKKIGCYHEGFQRPIAAPAFRKTGAHRFFVLCSPAWNGAIREQIRGMDLGRFTLIDALK